MTKSRASVKGAPRAIVDEGECEEMGLEGGGVEASVRVVEARRTVSTSSVVAAEAREDGRGREGGRRGRTVAGESGES